MNFVVMVPTSDKRLEDRERLAEQLSQAARRKGHVPDRSARDGRFVVLLDGLEQDELFKPATTVSGLLEACGKSELIPEESLFMVRVHRHKAGLASTRFEDPAGGRAFSFYWGRSDRPGTPPKGYRGRATPLGSAMASSPTRSALWALIAV